MIQSSSNMTNETIEFQTLDNDCGLSVTFSNLGASIYAIRYLGRIMTLTPSTVDEFSLEGFYHGKTIGRTRNRIEGSQIEIDGKTYDLDANEGPNVLHGGHEGLSTRLFPSRYEENDCEKRLVFEYVSPDGESGYPGNLSVKVTYILDKKSPRLSIRLEADADAPTYCALTNHAFFTVGEKNLKDVSFKVNASRYLKTRKEDLIPIGDEDVTPALDFRKGKKLFKDIDDPDLLEGKAKGYDHHFIFDDGSLPNAILKGKEFQMEVESDFPGLQIYSDNYPGGSFLEVEGEIRRGLAIEPQESFLHREILRPGEHYDHLISYVFSKVS